jgi:hypothetical protein
MGWQTVGGAVFVVFDQETGEPVDVKDMSDVEIVIDGE